MDRCSGHLSRLVVGRSSSGGILNAEEKQDRDWSLCVSHNTAANVNYVGIDISKANWDVHVVPSNKSFSIAVGDEAVQQLKDKLPKLSTCRIVVEATGCMERQLAADLTDAGAHVTIINPRQVRDFAREAGGNVIDLAAVLLDIPRTDSVRTVVELCRDWHQRAR